MESYLISIHAPREGGDHTTFRDLRLTVGISIHAPREGGDRWGPVVRHGGRISIHAPREGGDTMAGAGTAAPHQISIHAPREGGDILKTNILAVV